VWCRRRADLRRLLLTIAAGDDQTAATLHVRLDTLVWVYRIALFAGPVIAACSRRESPRKCVRACPRRRASAGRRPAGRNARAATKKKGRKRDDAMLIFALRYCSPRCSDGTFGRGYLCGEVRVVPRRAAVGLARRTVAASRRTGRRRLLFIDRTHAAARRGCKSPTATNARDSNCRSRDPRARRLSRPVVAGGPPLPNRVR